MKDLDARPDWDVYFLGIASAVAERGDCCRCRVGAVVVGPDRRIRSTGYNGSYPGGPSCSTGECPRCLSKVPSGTSYEDCIETHAEANSLLYADWTACQGATIYITRPPCKDCTKLIRSAGIHQVVYLNHGTTDHIRFR
ncbi:deoxycytidylate deaminase [Streptomyces noursei]|uniref:deoxycytidylate deaminase n=1 Tax=Streptomyces noursei TaxID=1971 RepID=UPI0016764C8B|nr:cytidine deaminase [Streptomyces noursei]